MPPCSLQVFGADICRKQTVAAFVQRWRTAGTQRCCYVAIASKGPSSRRFADFLRNDVKRQLRALLIEVDRLHAHGAESVHARRRSPGAIEDWRWLTERGPRHPTQLRDDPLLQQCV